MIISTAFAQSGGAGAGFVQLIPFLFIFVVFYFFLIRPQQKKAKEHKLMTENLNRGDKITTSGGLIATVSKAVEGQDIIEVEISQNVKVSLVRAMVAELREKKGTKK